MIIIILWLVSEFIIDALPLQDLPKLTLENIYHNLPATDRRTFCQTCTRLNKIGVDYDRDVLIAIREHPQCIFGELATVEPFNNNHATRLMDFFMRERGLEFIKQRLLTPCTDGLSPVERALFVRNSKLLTFLVRHFFVNVEQDDIGSRVCEKVPETCSERLNLEKAIMKYDFKLANRRIKTGISFRYSTQLLKRVAETGEVDVVRFLLEHNGAEACHLWGCDLMDTLRDINMLELLASFGVKSGRDVLLKILHEPDFIQRSSTLIRAGANINVRNRHKKTLLHLTAQYWNDTYKLLFLLDNGADPNKKDHIGQTAFDVFLATWNKHLKTVTVHRNRPKTTEEKRPPKRDEIGQLKLVYEAFLRAGLRRKYVPKGFEVPRI